MKQEYILINVDTRKHIEDFAILPNGNVFLIDKPNDTDRFILLRSVPNKFVHNKTTGGKTSIFELDKISFKYTDEDEYENGLVFWDNELCGWFIMTEWGDDVISFNSIQGDIITHGTCATDIVFLTSRADVVSKYVINIERQRKISEKLTKLGKKILKTILLKIKKLLE